MLLPRFQHVQRRLPGDQPADKRLRLGIPFRGNQTPAHLHQTLKKRIPLRAAFNQQAAGAGAALSGGNECRLNGQVDRSIDIIRIFHNQRVVTTHLQRQNFFRLPRQLTMQLITRSGTAGKQQTVNVAQRTQRLTGFTPALHQIQHARRQPRLLPEFYYCFSG